MGFIQRQICDGLMKWIEATETIIKHKQTQLKKNKNKLNKELKRLTTKEFVDLALKHGYLDPDEEKKLLKNKQL